MKQIINSRYTDPEHEAFFEDFKKSIVSHSQLNGQQHAAINQPTNLVEFKVRCLNSIKEKIQGAIEYNRQKYQPISGLVLVRQIELAAGKKIAALVSAMNDDDHRLSILQAKMGKLIKPDHNKRIFRRILYAALVFMSISEAILVLQALLINIPENTALACAITAGIILGFGGHFGGGFVRKAKNWREFILRLSAIMVAPVILFTALGAKRAEAYNSHINLFTETAYLQPAQTAVSSFDISMISIIFFLAAVLFSCWAHKTNEEKNIDNTYDELLKKITKVEIEKKAKLDSIEAIKQDVEVKKELAFTKWEYASGFEQRLVALAGETAESYKEFNIRHRTDTIIPACFADSFAFSFILFFDRSKNN